MINLIQHQTKLFHMMRWHCDNITCIVDNYFKECVEIYNHWSYIQVFDTSDNFKVNTKNHWIRFAIRCPGSTIGYFKCNAFGKIIEIEIYNDNLHMLNSKLKKLIGERINTVELAKIQFVNNNIKLNNNADIKILWFIANFIYHQPNDYITSSEIIINQFRAGYCLHFAMILKTFFTHGEICWAAPFGHMVYMYNNIPYDIEGINSSDCDYYIPISYIEKGIEDFTRVPGDYFNASQEYIDDAIKKYKENNKIE